MQLSADLPEDPNQPFKLTITENELTKLVWEEASAEREARYQWITVNIYPDRLVLKTFAKFEAAGLGLDIEADGMPIIVDGQVRFKIDSLQIADSYQQLTQFITMVVINTLNKSLYFMQPTQKANIRQVFFRATRVELLEGAMVIEGITD